jgi:DAK2 domain fusion protein YloV
VWHYARRRVDTEKESPTVLRVLDASAIRRWADISADLLDAYRGELDRINVFPVADADTGTNLALTVRAAAEALHRLPPTDSPERVEIVAMALARGALRGARGNSGVIVSQVFRGLAEAFAEHRDAGCAEALVDGLCRADELARSAVSRPVEGTVLTVLRASASAARTGVDLAEVVTSALEGASAALADTPRELPELARAGVVDAGGWGLVLLLQALAEAIGARPAAVGQVVVAASGHARDRSALLGPRETGSAEFDYEVMYLLSDSSGGRVGQLRDRLSELGDSVVVAGDGGAGADDGAGRLWHVHVHCTDIGAVFEAGMAAGRPHRITVIRFADQLPAGAPADDRFRTARAVLTVVPCEPVAELVRTDGVIALVAAPDRPPSVSRLVAAMTGASARHLVVLPNDVELNPVAEEAAELARESGQEVVVVPTSSVLQGLAALAVHDVARRPGDDVVAMAEAAAGTRTGVLRIADVEALTWAGRCQAGDVLGLLDGEVVLIEHELAAGARRLADRMLTVGGELVTVLLGVDGPPELGRMLQEHLRRSHPEVEVVLYRGGPAGAPLQLGVE